MVEFINAVDVIPGRVLRNSSFPEKYCAKKAQEGEGGGGT